MKSLQESLNINEARQLQYRVSFNDTKDEEGLPYGVTILVDKEYQKDFERFLEKEEMNIFAHAAADTHNWAGEY